jgi:tetratricopeptide (TPR) repeat protein
MFAKTVFVFGLVVMANLILATFSCLSVAASSAGLVAFAAPAAAERPATPAWTAGRLIAGHWLASTQSISATTQYDLDELGNLSPEEAKARLDNVVVPQNTEIQSGLPIPPPGAFTTGCLGQPDFMQAPLPTPEFSTEIPEFSTEIEEEVELTPLPIYTKPGLVKVDPGLDRRTFEPSAAGLCLCGYAPHEVVQTTLLNPLGEPIPLSQSTAQAAPITNDSTPVPNYCYGVGNFEFLPGDPLGEYTLKISSSTADLRYSFNLLPLTGPVVYYSYRAGGYVVAGFDPHERVKIMAYQADDYHNYHFIGGFEFQLDAQGTGLLLTSLPDPGQAIFVVNQNFDYTSTVDRGASPLNFDYLIALNRANPYFYYQRGLDAQLPERKIENFSQAIQLKPDMAEAYYQLGLTYAGLSNNPQQAAPEFSKAIELKPDFAQACYELAHVYDQQGDLDQARSYFTKALALEETGREPVLTYDRVIELNPGLALAYFRRGEVHHRALEFDKALADYNTTLELDPAYAPAYAARAGLYTQQGQVAEAVDDYNQLIRLQPTSPVFYYKLAQLYDRQGSSIMTLGHLFQALTLDEDGYGAINDYNRALELDPNLVLAYYRRGQAFQRYGLVDKASADFMQVLQRATDSRLRQLAQQHLSELE